jgi:hypothetical protein
MSDQESFSMWCRWENREENRDGLPGLDCPGIYLLAHFAEKPPAELDATVDQVIYVGETCAQSLKKRLRNFNRSATTGKFSHSAGRSYFKLFAGIQPTLFVAILPISGSEPALRSARIRHLERKFIYEHTLACGPLPVCNRR